MGQLVREGSGLYATECTFFRRANRELLKGLKQMSDMLGFAFPKDHFSDRFWYGLEQSKTGGRMTSLIATAVNQANKRKNRNRAKQTIKMPFRKQNMWITE